MNLRIVSLLFLSLFLVSCSKFPGEDITTYNFAQGIKEAELRFLQNAPPKEVLPSADFKIIVEVENQAAYPLEDAVVSLIGLKQPLFQPFTTREELPLLQGRSALSPLGDKGFAEFDVFVNDLPPGKRQKEETFRVELAYHSTMEFVDTVCVTANLYGIYDSGCTVNDRKSYRGQGAPLAVTEMQEIITPSEVEFRFRVENKGKGKANFVNVNDAKLGSDELRCEFLSERGRTTIKLGKDNQEAVLVCRGIIRAQRSYTTTLTIGFSYDYELGGKRAVSVVQ